MNIIDSVQNNPAGGYIGKTDEAQLTWLNSKLAEIPSSEYICIISHIPILSICSGLFFNKTEANGDLMIKRNLMHSDFLSLKTLFNKHPNIKTCLSGHVHLQDEVHYHLIITATAPSAEIGGAALSRSLPPLMQFSIFMRMEAAKGRSLIKVKKNRR